MAKEKSESKEERRARKAEKKSTKTLTEDSGVNGTSKHKSEKKDKKDGKKERKALAEKALNDIQTAEPSVVKKNAADDGDDEVDTQKESKSKNKLANRPIGALVPFAHPLADDKVGKKCFKAVKRAAAQRTLKRGVKEVVKALRKSPSNAPASSLSSDTADLPLGTVILAADISPMDVISHIPVLCEDHNIPYIFVTSRAELGMAGQTKRPTSVVMVARDVPAKKGDKTDEDGGEEWSETYKGLVKTILKEAPQVRK